MLLEFVWIKEYGVIKNQGFNFNPNVTYTFDESTGVIHREVKNQMPANFFSISNDTISHISAIVGANGTGKSSVLEFIASFLTYSRPLGGIIITEKYLINKTDIQIHFSKKWMGEKLTSINRLDLINTYREESGYKKQDKTEDTRNNPMGLRILGNLIKDTRLIYYSGEANLQHTNRVYQSLLSLTDEYESSVYTDISDISMMSNDQHRYRSDKAVYSGENPILTFRSGESQRFLNLIISEHRSFIPFSVDHLQIYLSLNDIDDSFFASYDEIAFVSIMSLLLLFLKTSKKKYSESTISIASEIELHGIGGFFNQKLSVYTRKSKINKFELQFYHRLLLRHVREQIMETMGELTEQNKLQLFLGLINDIEKHFANSKTYLAQIKSYLKQSKFAAQYTGNANLNKITGFLDSLKELNLWNDGEGKIIINLSDKALLDKANALMKQLDQSSGLEYSVSTIFDFDIRGLSTGERQFLKIFSRFFSYRLNNKLRSKEIQYIILLDEFELGFHPIWQRKFLKTWIDFLEKFINQSDNRPKIKVQLIITSHSPFIVSDLPKDSINFLSKGEGEKYSKVDDLTKHVATFGANIHSLFTDAFFLEDGLMGDFAQFKIDELIRSIFKQSTFSIDDYKTLKPFINIIGEPFIRVKLLEKIADGMKKRDLDIMISERETEINFLKNISNDKNRPA